MTAALIQALASRSATADKLAAVICRLAVAAAELGELEPYEIPDPLHPPDGRLQCKRLRHEWLDRLTVAVECGALATMEVERIVEILLQGRPAAAPTRAVA
jgi:hypothetical protein